MLPYLFSEGVRGRRITLERLTQITASEPARFLGIDHRKGRLCAGFDADFVVFDERQRWTGPAPTISTISTATRRSRAASSRVEFDRPLSGVARSSLFQRRTKLNSVMPDIGQWVRRGVA